MPAAGGPRLLALLLLLAASFRTRGALGQPTLRAPGASVNDGRLITGVLATSGAAAALSQYTPIFSDYLNAALGATLGKTFVTVALDDTDTYEVTAQDRVDFIFTYATHVTCLASQLGAPILASVQSLHRPTGAPDTPVPLSSFGGVFFALASRADINTLADVAGRRLQGADITSLGAAQAQWRELTLRGLSFWNLPSQVIFSHNQYKVVADVATGFADVGMARADFLAALQLPAPYCNETAQAALGLGCFPPGTFKVLEPQMLDGNPFPSSTRELWPEWPLAAMPHVDVTTQKAVTGALFALGGANSTLQYAAAARRVHACQSRA
jgi:ABC-type phosphate/phosphonate transport system substrate-binding protein